MYKVGLTGGIGSGKTLVCSVLEKLGVAVYYADSEARRLMNENPALVTQITGLFGSRAYRGGSLNREFLANRVFKDQAMLSRLNDLVHPVVQDDFTRWTDRQKHAPYLVKEAAILFESGSYRQMDLTALVVASVDLRLTRVMKRDGVSREEILNRMNKQMSEEEKMERADFVINNDGIEMLLPQIIKLHNYVLNRI